MQLTLIRYSSQDETTLGLLYINGQFTCYTLEDQYQSQKVNRETCIPKGRYQLALRTEGGSHQRYLKRFPQLHKGMLHVLKVPGFQWILIHIGNTDEDTAGCILVGDETVSNVQQEGRINNSAKAYKYLYPIVADALASGEDVWLEVCGF